ncbi:MAG: hypothetical protein ACLUE8_14300 [Lachnospiraceae bacterium]
MSAEKSKRSSCRGASDGNSKVDQKKGPMENFSANAPTLGLTDFFPFCIGWAACCRKEAKKENL